MDGACAFDRTTRFQSECRREHETGGQARCARICTGALERACARARKGIKKGCGRGARMHRARDLSDITAVIVVLVLLTPSLVCAARVLAREGN